MRVTILVLAAIAAVAQAPRLTQVYHDNDYQITGVTISKSGRLFVNYPRWSDRYMNAVVEVTSASSSKPFPDETWNRWDGKPETAGKAFVCVQSVVVDDQDSLWVLDPAAPMMGPVVQGGPKLVRIDLKTNQVTRVIPFGPDVATPKSYLNDIRIRYQKEHSLYDRQRGRRHRSPGPRDRQSTPRFGWASLGEG